MQIRTFDLGPTVTHRARVAMWIGGMGQSCDFLTMTTVGKAGTSITTYGVTVVEGRAVMERLAEHDEDGIPPKIAEARRAKFLHRDHYEVDLRTMACTCMSSGGCKHADFCREAIRDGLIEKPNEGDA